MTKKFYTKTSDIAEIKLGNDPNTDGLEPTTLWEELDNTLGNIGNQYSYQSCPHLLDGNYYTSKSCQSWTFENLNNITNHFARSLIHFGFEKHQSVNIIGFNSFEWVVADLGCIKAGGVSAGVYTTNGEEVCQYQADHSDAHTIVIEGEKNLIKYKNILEKEINGGLPKLKVVVTYNLHPKKLEKHKEVFNNKNVTLISYKDFLKASQDDQDELDKKLKVRIKEQKPGSCIKLIYTSGTTGLPKAVMISHDNFVWTIKMFYKHSGNIINYSDKMLSYLPLSHIAAQVLDIGLPLIYGVKVSFARPDAFKGSLLKSMTDVRPTLFFGVPRVWEKIANKIKVAGQNNGFIKSYIASWAKYIGYSYSLERQDLADNGFPNFEIAETPYGYMCSKLLVFNKVKDLLGLDRCKLCLTGAAPVSKETLDLFSSLDLPIMEVYGQSECTGPSCSTTPYVGWKIGSVGPAIPGTKMRINPENKQIEYIGRHIFMGYLKNKEKSEESFTEDGWLASGDQGQLDEDNFLRITGRIKELIIGAGGENIAPILIEKEMKKQMPWLSNCVVFGERKPYLGMFLSLMVKMNLETGEPTDELEDLPKNFLKSIGSNAETYSEAKKCPILNQQVKNLMQVANSNAISRAQTVKFYLWLPEDLSVPGGTLTSTFKLKRNVLYKKYAEEMEQGYKKQSEMFKKK